MLKNSIKKEKEFIKVDDVNILRTSKDFERSQMKNLLEICLSPYSGGLELYMKNITKELNTKAVINKKSKLKNIFNNEKIDYFEISRYSFFKLARIIDKEN